MSSLEVKSSDLRSLFEKWKRWSTTADRSEDGWESDFPEWEALIEAACLTMKESVVEPDTIALLAECWSAAQEDEELLGCAGERLLECWPILQALAQSHLPGCRWQVYEAVAAGGAQAEPILRQGLSDPDEYARRRALLSLARIGPRDAQALAEFYLKDPDPYMRQAAINMVLASPDVSFQRHALSLLRTDAVDHVRSAAEAAWRKLNPTKR